MTRLHHWRYRMTHRRGTPPVVDPAAVILDTAKWAGVGVNTLACSPTVRTSRRAWPRCFGEAGWGSEKGKCI